MYAEKLHVYGCHKTHPLTDSADQARINRIWPRCLALTVVLILKPAIRNYFWPERVDSKTLPLEVHTL